MNTPYHINVKKENEKNIKVNREILRLFGVNSYFPDDTVTAHYLGIKYKLEENLSIDDIDNLGKSIKGLRLYQRTKEVIRTADDIPDWVSKVIEQIRLLPIEANSVLRE